MVSPVECDAQTVARRLVHLTVHHGHLGVRQIVLVDDARLDHLVIEVIAFAGPLTDARKHGQTAVLALAMLLMSSSMFTVLPTPAPPTGPLCRPWQRAPANRSP